MAYDAQVRPAGETKPNEIESAENGAETRTIDAKENAANELRGEWKRQSVLGRMGQAIEPAVRPLGWDWRIGMAALASFPAREVVVGTLGVIYNEGEVDADEVHARSTSSDAVRQGDLGRRRPAARCSRRRWPCR